MVMFVCCFSSCSAVGHFLMLINIFLLNNKIGVCIVLALLVVDTISALGGMYF